MLAWLLGQGRDRDDESVACLEVICDLTKAEIDRDFSPGLLVSEKLDRLNSSMDPITRITKQPGNSNPDFKPIDLRSERFLWVAQLSLSNIYDSDPFGSRQSVQVRHPIWIEFILLKQTDVLGYLF